MRKLQSFDKTWNLFPHYYVSDSVIHLNYSGYDQNITDSQLMDNSDLGY